MKYTGLRSQRRPWRGEGEQSGFKIQESHEKLLLQAQNGCKHARARLCEFIFVSAQRYARTSGLPPVYELSDFAQDVTIEFIEQVESIQRLRTWLVPVLVGRRALAFRRYNDTLFDSLDDVLPKIDANSAKLSEEEHSRQMARLDVRVLLDQLREPYKSIMIMRCVEGKSFDDIAKALELKPGTVRMYFLRSKKRLQKYLNLLHGEDASHGIDK